MRAGSAPLALALALLLAPLAAAATGCDEGGSGTKQLGDRCEDDGECLKGLCVGGVAGEAPVCTRSCGGDDECPEGWSCSGVTSDDVLVCREGAATPFGQ